MNFFFYRPSILKSVAPLAISSDTEPDLLFEAATILLLGSFVRKKKYQGVEFSIRVLVVWKHCQKGLLNIQ